MKTIPKYFLSKWKNRELEPMKASPDLRFDWPQGYTIATSVIFRTQVWNLILEKSWRWCGVFFGTKDKRRRRSRGEVLSGIIIGRILQCYYYPTSTNFFLLSPFLQDPSSVGISKGDQTETGQYWFEPIVLSRCNVWIFPLAHILQMLLASKINSHISAHLCPDCQDGRWIIKSLKAN